MVKSTRTTLQSISLTARLCIYLSTAQNITYWMQPESIMFITKRRTNCWNSSGLYIDKQRKVFDIILLKKSAPVRESIMINAEIKTGGKLEGTAQISNTSYNRIAVIDKYKTDGEQKYMDFLRDGDNNIKISTVKLDNMEVDTLPLMQNIGFNMDLGGIGRKLYLFKPEPFYAI